VPDDVKDVIRQFLGKKAINTPFPVSESYKVFFDESPIAMIEEDFSRIKNYLESLKKKKIAGDLRTFLSDNPDVVDEIIPLVRIISMNKAALKLYSSDDKAELVEKMPKLFTDRSREHYIDSLISIAENKLVYEHEQVTRDLFGEERNLAVKWHVIPGHEESWDRVMVSLIDITKQKRAEDNFRASERKFHYLVKESHDGIMLTDQQGNIIEWNRGLEQITGMSKGEVEGKKIWKVQAKLASSEFNPAIEEGIKKRMLAALKGNAPQNFGQLTENELTDQQGEKKYVQSAAFPIKTRNGFMIGGITRNITQNKQSELVMRESEARYRSLFEDSPISLWEEDFSAVKHYFDELKNQGVDDFRNYFDLHPDDVLKCISLIKVIAVNKATLELYEAKNQEELLKFIEIAFFDDILVFKEEFVTLAEGGTEFSLEARSKKLDGSIFHHFLQLSVAPGHEDSLDRVVISMIDITDKKDATESLLKQKEEIELYLNILTHDLKNFHLATKGFMDLALMDPLPLDAVEMIEQARASNVRSNSLTENITIMMKSELPWTYLLQPVNLEVIVSKVAREISELFPGRKVTINLNSILPGFSVLADSLFEQLVLNLFTNSVKSDDKETVELEIEIKELEDGKALVMFKDKGKGIPPEERELIFDRFKTFKRTGRGSGLGLHIVKTLANRYHGKIWIEDRIPGEYEKGTVFCLELKYMLTSENNK